MTPNYVQTGYGEIHYWRCGAGTPLVLLHWAPSSGRFYAKVAPHFAAHGFEVIAFDLPGYGRSHKNNVGWPIPKTAANLLEAIDGLDLGPLDLLGGHLSASVATAMSVAGPARIRRLVLDGALNLEGQEWNKLLGRFGGLSPRIDAGGLFKQFPMAMVLRTLEEWNPDFELSRSTLPQVYELLNDYLEMGLEPMAAFLEPGSPHAPPPYDLAAALPMIRQPTLLLTCDREPLSDGFARTLAAIPDCAGHRFADTHPLLSGREADYAEVVSRFLKG